MNISCLNYLVLPLMILTGVYTAFTAVMPAHAQDQSSAPITGFESLQENVLSDDLEEAPAVAEPSVDNMQGTEVNEGADTKNGVDEPQSTETDVQADIQPSNSNEPIEITADGALEWHRNDLRFIATKNALAKQGDVSLAAAKLTADYTEGEQSNFQISRVHADENVRIQSRDTEAFGDKATYDISTGYAEMTGNNLKLVSPEQTVTARDKFEYWTNEGRLVAIGDAILTRINEQGETNTLNADTLTAFMKDDQNGKRVLDRLEATGNVIITTPTETLTGQNAVYNANTNIAEITGNVQIKRGPNILEGTKADVNLTTNISRMFGGGNAKTRVRGVFYPNTKKD